MEDRACRAAQSRLLQETLPQAGRLPCRCRMRDVGALSFSRRTRSPHIPWRIPRVSRLSPCATIQHPQDRVNLGVAHEFASHWRRCASSARDGSRTKASPTTPTSGQPTHRKCQVDSVAESTPPPSTGSSAIGRLRDATRPESDLPEDQIRVNAYIPRTATACPGVEPEVDPQSPPITIPGQRPQRER